MTDVAIGIDIRGYRTKSGLINIQTGDVMKMIVHAIEKIMKRNF